MGTDKKIKFREEEYNEIKYHLEEGIERGGQSKMLVIAGVPGVGKTFTL